jgi:hypothetical protein
MLKLDKVSVAGSSSVTMLMNTVNVNNIVTEKAKAHGRHVVTADIHNPTGKTAPLYDDESSSSYLHY